MRCPNLECRQVFTVRALEEKGPEPVHELPPPPVPQPPKAAKPSAKAPKPAKPAKSPQGEVVDAVIVDAAVVSPPKAKEVVWSEGTDVPPKRSRKPLTPEAVDDGLPVRRKKKTNRAPMVLAIMVVGIVAAVGFGVGYIFVFEGKKEEKLEERAKEEYGKGNYGEALKGYEKLVKEHADSKDIDKYKFFADLSSMQTVVRGVTNREDYDAAVKRLTDFIEAQKASPLAKPTSGFGRDILEAGKKLSEDVAEHATDRVKAFQADRAKNAGELGRADKAIATGRTLIGALDPFRGPDDAPLDKLKTAFDQAEKAVKRERDRTAALTRARGKLESPSDAVIQEVEADLAAAGFLDDPESQTIIAEAKGRLRDLVKYEDDPAAAQPPPPTVAASLLFVTPIGKTKAREPGPGDPPAGVYLCVARGILYAFNEDSGALVWAMRVGPDVTDPPAVARVDLPTGPTEIAIVTSNVGNAPALVGHILKPDATRDPVFWYQPLPAPAAGPAVVVGNRAFVPVRDAVGTVYEFDLATGTRLGRVRLGQPVAERGAVLRPGTNLLYIAADARRLYLIDAGGKDDTGIRVNPRCVQVMATGHLAGTLRVPPVFIGPEGTEPADRWMVLAQAEGTGLTRLRAFPVGPVAPPPADGTTVPETPAVPAVALAVPGWVAFAPVTDGERLAVLSDTAQFRLFGVNQPGNQDKPLFPLIPPRASGAGPERPIPGLVVPVEEATYWLVAAGQLQKVRLALVPNKGLEVVAVGAPLALGEPVQAAQVSARKDAACVVVRSLTSSGCRAVVFDLRDGEIRWQRQLGLVPARQSSGEQFAAPVAQGDRFVLVDEDGGIVAVPVAGGAIAGQTIAAPPAWGLADAPTNATGPTVVVAVADGKVAYALTPVDRERPKFLIRRIGDGKIVATDEVPAPAAVAGQPAVVGDSLLIPTADGFVYRLVPGSGPARPGALVAGPSWLGERRSAHAACSITPLSDSAFAVSDGGRKLARWEWPAGAAGKWNSPGVWELREAVAGPARSCRRPKPAGRPGCSWPT
ncbi:outer membrane protein assembly factor BamB family protein [Frigoriglobus tundricola]|nr:PQQ-binding-like beta-propeller repeat protein [Frigoriglobus tundricola]